MKNGSNYYNNTIFYNSTLQYYNNTIFNIIYRITITKNNDETKINCKKIHQAFRDTNSSESDISETDLFEEIKAIRLYFNTEKYPSDILLVHVRK